MRYNDGTHTILITEIVAELLKIALPVTFLLNLLCLVVEVKRGGAGLQLLQKMISECYGVRYLNSLGMCL